MNRNKNTLLIFDGPAGAGKTTLLNIILRWKNFDLMECATTRKKRISDGPEMECITEQEFHARKISGEIILPQVYGGNKKWYGIKKSSLERLQQNNMVGVIYPEWKIIDELRKKYNVVALFISARQEILIKRLYERKDIPKKRQECIEYIPTFLKKYETNKHKFDYHLKNNTTLKDLENAVKKILKNHKA